MGSNFKANCRQTFAAVSANLVTFSFGVYTGWSATMMPTLKSQSMTPLDHALSVEAISWACSWGMLSAILGSFFWGWLADKYGPKVTGFLTMMPYLISWIMLLVVKTETVLMMSRFLGGLSASGAAINSPMYVGEISDRHMKAGLGSLFIMMYNMGVLYVYVFGVLVPYDYLNVACLFVSVLFMVVWCYVPESPIYLIRKGDPDAARKSLQWLRGKDNEKEVEDEMDAMTHCGDHLTTAKLSDYMERGTLKAMLIGIVFQTASQFSGINIILMYTVDIFKASGSSQSPEICTILVGTMQVFGSVIASCVVNKAGRKFFLMLTYAMAAVALITIGLCLYLNTAENNTNTGPLPVLSLCLHVIAFSLGLGMVPYIMYTEIFPANVRNMCMSMLMFWNNALGFVIMVAYPYMNNVLHLFGSFWLFGVACLAAIPFTYFFVPETKDKTFEMIQRNLMSWFTEFGGNDKAVVMVPMESTKVVVVESSAQKVYMEQNQNCFAAPA